MAGTRGGGGYARGEKAVAICERCAKKVPYKSLRYDGQYPDLQVCPECWDPKHPQEYLEDVFDPITLRDPTGDPDREFANNVVIRPWNLIRFDPEGPVDPRSFGTQGIDIAPYRPGAFNDVTEFQLILSPTLNATRFNALTGNGIEVT